MSVNSIYLAVDWPKFLEASQPPGIAERIFSALENEEPWIRSFPFGNQVDEYLFDSRNGLGEFDDWFRDVRKRLNIAYTPKPGPSEPFDLDTDLLALLRRKLGGFLGRAARRNPFPPAQHTAIKSFCALFLDFGLICDDDTLALKPIRQPPGFDDESLIAAMSPKDVVQLRDRAAGINRRVLEAWFEKALALKPCRLIEDGKTAAAWLDALNEGLADTVRNGEGVIFGMA